MNNTVVTTLPLKPRETLKDFHYIVPVLVEQTGKLLNCKTNLMINNIGHYENLDVEKFKQNLNKRDLHFDSVKIDKEHLDFLVGCIKKLIEENKIVEKTVQVYQCECGTVNILKEGVRDFDKGDLYTFDDDGNMVCSLCKTKAKLYETKLLVIENIEQYFNANVCPLYMQKMMQDFVKQRSSYLLLSKKRETGVKLEHNGQTYNLDIDFVWANFPQLFEEQNVIIFTASDLLYESFIVNLMNNLHNNKNVIIVHQAKISSSNKQFENEFDKLNNEQFKLNIAFNSNLKTYTTKWNEVIFNYLLNSNETDIKKLMQYPGYKNKFDEQEITPKSIECNIKYGFNFQFNKNNLKK